MQKAKSESGIFTTLAALVTKCNHEFNLLTFTTEVLTITILYHYNVHYFFA